MLNNYLKVAWKVLLRRKFFTFISLFGVSLTLLVLVVLTALFDHVFAAQPPEVHGERTLGIYVMGMKGPESTRTGLAGYLFLDRFVRPMRQELDAVENVTCFSTPETVASYQNGRKIALSLKRTDGEFWRVLHFDFLEGGPFTVDDDHEARFVAVINEATREKFFAGEKALGKTLEVDGQRFQVVGVVPNVPLLRIAPFADVWVPLGTAKSDAHKKELVGAFMGLILARSRADFAQIKAEVAARLVAAQPLLDAKTYDTLSGGADTPFEAASRLLLSGDAKEGSAARLAALLLLLALLFMLLPAINLVNINLSRILDRSSEIGVRKAFGASSATLVGQFVVENILLTLLGGFFGLLLAIFALGAINASEVIPHAHLTIHFRVFCQALLIALCFGVLSGAYPALRMSRLHPVEALKGKNT